MSVKHHPSCATQNAAETENTCDCQARSSLAAKPGSVRTLVVTQDMVHEIIQRARASGWGLDEPKCATTMADYVGEDAHTLALLLVNGWEAKYDLISLFAAALEVVNEKAQTPGTCQQAQ